MLPSLVRRSSLALVVSFALNGCGGRSLDADVVQWYDPDAEAGGEEAGGNASKGGAFYGTKNTKGGSTFSSKSTYSYGGAEMQPTGGSYYKSSKATTAYGGYSSSSRTKATTPAGGQKASTYRSSYVGGKGGTSSSGQGGSTGGSSWTTVAGSYSLGGTAGSTSLPNAAGASWCASSTTCSGLCQSGYWWSPSGCYECACAPPVTQLSYSDPTLGVSCPAALLTSTSTVSVVQSNRLDFVFTWTCSALIEGQPVTGMVRASITPSASAPVDTSSRTYRLDDTLPTLSIDQAQLSAQATAINLTPTTAGTWLSIRREGSYVHGGIYFVGSPSSGENVTLAGEFILLAPN